MHFGKNRLDERCSTRALPDSDDEQTWQQVRPYKGRALMDDLNRSLDTDDVDQGSRE